MRFNFSEKSIDRFLSNVPSHLPDDTCWEYQGNRLWKSEYGRYSQELAHRIAYAIEYGPIPDDICVCHTCDNPPCCNPGHLFLGTHKDNSDDRDRKGRNKPGYVPGVKNGMSKIDENMVWCIRAMYATGAYTLHSLATEFGISKSNVWFIVKRQTWAHVK